MGRGCNRVTPKMKAAKRKDKVKEREKRRRAEKYKARTGKDVPAGKLTS